MFENEFGDLDAAGTLAAADANEHVLITAEIRRLHIAAPWADLHSGDAVVDSPVRGTERAVRLGGNGTQTVADFASAELGCVLRMSDGSASRLIADALDLRHRLHLIWTAAQSGQVPTHQARYIATVTRHLTVEQAAEVDELSLSQSGQGRAARPNSDRQPRTARPSQSPAENSWRWRVRQPEPGIWLWRSPRHRIYLVNSFGTHPIGDSAYAQAVWRAAESPAPVLAN